MKLLPEVPRVIKSIETGSRVVVSRGWWRLEWELVFDRDRVLVWGR